MSVKDSRGFENRSRSKSRANMRQFAGGIRCPKGREAGARQEWGGRGRERARFVRLRRDCAHGALLADGYWRERAANGGPGFELDGSFAVWRRLCARQRRGPVQRRVHKSINEERHCDLVSASSEWRATHSSSSSRTQRRRRMWWGRGQSAICRSGSNIYLCNARVHSAN